MQVDVVVDLPVLYGSREAVYPEAGEYVIDVGLLAEFLACDASFTEVETCFGFRACGVAMSPRYWEVVQVSLSLLRIGA